MDKLIPQELAWDMPTGGQLYAVSESTGGDNLYKTSRVRRRTFRVVRRWRLEAAERDLVAAQDRMAALEAQLKCCRRRLVVAQGGSPA